MKYSELISQMTLEEKAAFFSGKNFWETHDDPEKGIPGIFLADGPHGVRKQAAAADHLGLNASLKATCFPTSATMANSWNPELGEKMGTALGEEAVCLKVNVLLGPGLNIKRSPLCGRNFEYFSEDPYLAGKMAASYVRGIQSNGISACLKHFAANNQETRRMVTDSVIDERTMREIYLTNFEIAVKEGKAKTIMTAYNLLNGVYANESYHLLRDILRGEWGYEGVIVTDWGGDNDRVQGLIAGNELEMPTTAGDTNKDIVAAVKAGQIPESLVDENLDRLLDLIFTTEQAFQGEKKTFDIDAHHEIALHAAEESAVLLKNEANALPLKAGTRVAVIGDFAKNPRYQGAGSSVVNPTKLDNALENFKDYDLAFAGYEQGYDRYGKKKDALINKALRLAFRKDVDAILYYMGLDEVTETEGMDRVNMKIPYNQRLLLEMLKSCGKKLIVVLSCGAAVETGWADGVDALLHSYLGEQAGACAALNILTGKTNPSGKLSESLPFKYEDCSTAKNFPGRPVSAEYREGPFIGYRYYDTADVAVNFPFGFGLSYTTFRYSNIKISKGGVKFTLTNTGGVAGAEIAQMYVGMPGSKIFRPKKELKGFQKVFLNAGESKEVEILFDEYTFRYFNVKTNKWETEPGEYEISIAASSADVRLTAVCALDSAAAPIPYSPAELPSYYSGTVADVSAGEFEKLLGRKPPEPRLKFIRRKRIIVDANTAIEDLRYAKGWTGRLFAGVLRFAYKLLKGIGNVKMANVLMMGVCNMPIRGLSRMTGGMMSWAKMQGLITMFNGKFFKGLGQFFNPAKAQRKTEKKAAKAAAKAK